MRWLWRQFKSNWQAWLLWLWRWTFLLVLAGVAGYFGGHLAAEPPATFDWTAGAIAATAAGTVVLAVVTWGLAYDTRRDVEATLNDQRTRDRPTVIVASLHIVNASKGLEGVEARVSASLFNMGLGPAIGVEARLAYVDADPEVLTMVSTNPSPAVLAFIPTGQSYTVEFDAKVVGPGEPLDPKRFIVLGDYFDRRGREGERYENGIIDGYRSDNLPPNDPLEPLVAFR